MTEHIGNAGSAASAERAESFDAAGPADSVVERVSAAVGEGAPMSMLDFLELALYDTECGFYGSGLGRAGRSKGDFITSPEVGPLFGAVMGRWLDERWRQQGEPDPFVCLEWGAGAGTLARTLLVAEPECAEALELGLVEVAEIQRAEHESVAGARSVTSLSPDEVDAWLAGEGRAGAGLSVVIANELLDNLVFGVAQRTADRWVEVRVGVDGGGLCEVLVELDADRSAMLDRLAPLAEPRQRAPLQAAAHDWCTRMFDLGAAHLLVIDYGATTAELATRGGWLRTYAQHGRGNDPFVAPGACDITSDVAFDQLPSGATVTTQAEWLTNHGIAELVEEGGHRWRELGPGGGLEAFRAHSRVSEAPALVDPDGLGAFAVLEWSRSGSIDGPKVLPREPD